MESRQKLLAGSTNQLIDMFMDQKHAYKAFKNLNTAEIFHLFGNHFVTINYPNEAFKLYACALKEKALDGLISDTFKVTRDEILNIITKIDINLLIDISNLTYYLLLSINHDFCNLKNADSPLLKNIFELVRTLELVKLKLTEDDQHQLAILQYQIGIFHEQPSSTLDDITRTKQGLDYLVRAQAILRGLDRAWVYLHMAKLYQQQLQYNIEIGSDRETINALYETTLRYLPCTAKDEESDMIYTEVGQLFEQNQDDPQINKLMEFSLSIYSEAIEVKTAYDEKVNQSLKELGDKKVKNKFNLFSMEDSDTEYDAPVSQRLGLK